MELQLVEIKPKTKVGIIPCNGEEIAEGTVTRHACRKVLDELRPKDTMTICLPLFIAGDKAERDFATNFPTITVDGCDKRCSQKTTEKLSGKPRHSIVVSELLKEKGLEAPEGRRTPAERDKEIADLIADEIAQKVDEIVNAE